MANISLPANYTCYRTARPPQIDGRLDDPVWAKAPQTARFVDMVSGDPGWWDTRASLVWDDQNLYIAFRIEEPFVEALQTERDSLVFLENDVEVFIDGGDCYYEFEINALGTIYEVFFIWQDAFRKGSRFDTPEFDLHTCRALSFAGNEDRTGVDFWKGTHPRGPRWAFLDWDFPGLQAEVEVDGKINDRSTVDRGWTVELAFPWAGMKHLAGGRALPPKEGDVWKFFLGRFQKLTACGREIDPHPAWCATPHGIYDTHMPERWTRVVFSEKDVESLS
jgi:hypothetical protein